MHYSELQSQAFLRADLENLLRAIRRTNEALVSHLADRDVQAYRLGFDAALEAVATALNVRLDPFEPVHNSRGMGPLVSSEARNRNSPRR